jgi:hypothetical protein
MGADAEPAALADYDYLFLTFDVAAASTAPRDFALRLSGEIGGRIAAAGGEAIGLFTPQLGWGSDEAALLLRWPGASDAREAQVAALAADPALAACRRDRLSATLRPAPGDRPKPGGIFVHRTFEIAASDADAFIALSGRAWTDFEGGFDTDIYGLFRTAPTADDLKTGALRMLLITRYADHGVWEASREPSAAARDLFMKRRDLTRRTRAASTVLAR